jgi:hypothetical protein
MPAAGERHVREPLLLTGRWAKKERVGANHVPESTEYDDDHSVDGFEHGYGNSSRSTREVNPLNRFAAYEAGGVGSCLIKRRTRLATAAPSPRASRHRFPQEV